MKEALLELEGVVKHFTVGNVVGGRQSVHAVDGVTLAIFEGESLALVGESGCGKSTLARCMVRLITPSEGAIRFQGQDITTLRERHLRPLRRSMQMIFQDPYDSLNPSRQVKRIIGDSLRAHGVREPAVIAERVNDQLTRVGLDPSFASRYPRQFSGGQRQRIAIARALVLRPKLIVADEPVAALDVSIQAQVINLMLDLQEELALTYVVISHDLGLVRQIADRVAVMYLGKLVELAPNEDLYHQPLHPYTEVLLASASVLDPDASRLDRVDFRGEPPSAIDPPSGCRFHPRCRYATEICERDEPQLVDHGGGHFAACHHPLSVGGGHPAATQ